MFNSILRNTVSLIVISHTIYINASILFGFKTPTYTNSTHGISQNMVTMTLYWETVKYQCNIYPEQLDAYYLCDTSNSSATKQCTLSPSNSFEYALQIDNNHDDALEIDLVIVDPTNDNETIVPDIEIDYFCLNKTIQSASPVNNPCLDTSFNAYNTLIIGNDSTNDPYQLIMLNDDIIDILSNDVNDSDQSLETYVYRMHQSADCGMSRNYIITQY